MDNRPIGAHQGLQPAPDRQAATDLETPAVLMRISNFWIQLLSGERARERDRLFLDRPRPGVHTPPHCGARDRLVLKRQRTQLAPLGLCYLSDDEQSASIPARGADSRGQKRNDFRQNLIVVPDPDMSARVITDELGLRHLRGCVLRTCKGPIEIIAYA